jgi:hypothetical protein
MSGDNQFALELAERILENKLKYIREMKAVGDSQAVEVESVKFSGEPYEFEVAIWDEQGENSTEVKIMNYQELKELIVNVIPEDFIDVMGFIERERGK